MPTHQQTSDHIPTFPEFTALNISHRRQIHARTGHFEPYSDFNFTSLFSWGGDTKTEVSLLNENLVIRMPDYLTGEIIYSFIGKHKVDTTISELLNYTSKLMLVPEVVIHEITDSDKFVISEDRDNFDYIYPIHELTHLAGSRYKKVRNKANRFTKDHTNMEIQVDIKKSIDESDITRLKEIDLKWVQQAQRDESDILAERKAISTLLEHADTFNLIVIELLVDGELKAFSINERLGDDFAICHFEKALVAHHVHINTFLVSQVAKALLNEGCKWINWEQDLGLPGLRKSKLAYRPYRLLKKYTVSLKHRSD